MNCLKHRKLNLVIPIQQSVKGSKPKCNAIATVTLQFGDWSKKTSMYVIHLANYNAILGLPTLVEAGARFDLTSNTLHLQEYGLSLTLKRFQPVTMTTQRQDRSPSSCVPSVIPQAARQCILCASRNHDNHNAEIITNLPSGR